jgi:hypothetical protein
LARSVLDSDTQAASIGVEHTLIDDTTHSGSVLDGYVDVSNLAAGDAVDITVYMMLLSGGLAIAYKDTFIGVQDKKIIYIPSVTEPAEYKLTLKQTTGTGRNFDWIVFKT